MRTPASACLVLLWIGGCAGSDLHSLSGENLRTVRFQTEPETLLFVLNDGREGPVWGMRDEFGKIALLKNIPDVALFEVDQLSISPGDEYLAVLSVGEGHPYLEVFRLEELIGSRDSNWDVTVEPIGSIDPYRGSISIVGWRKTQLVVQSDVPLHRLDKTKRRVDVLHREEKCQTFTWSPDTDEIVRN